MKNIKMISISDCFLFLTIIFMPVVNAFALGTYRNLSFVAVICGMLFLFGKNRLKLYNTIEYKFIFLIIIFLFFSLFSGINVRSFIDLRGYLFAFLFYIGFTLLLVNSEFKEIDVLKFVSYAIIIAMLYGLVDFFLANKFGFYLDKYIYRYSAEYPTLSIMGVYRLRSFTSEPGIFAIYLNTLGPISFYYFLKRNNKIFILLFFVLILTTYILNASTAGILFLIFSGLVTFLLFTYNSIRVNWNGFYIKKNYIGIAFIFFILLIIIMMLLRKSYLVQIMRYKLFGNSFSMQERIQKIQLSYNLLIYAWDNSIYKFIFGYGLGYFNSLYGHTTNNFILSIFIETGIFGVLLWISFFISILIKVLKIKTELKYFIFFAYCAALLHLSITARFQLPCVWFIFALPNYILSKQYSYYKNLSNINESTLKRF